MVTVVTEGIFSYCGVKVKIDTDRHLGPERALVRVDGEPVGHVTTAEYGSQMLSLGGVDHLTGGSKKEGRVTCETLLALCNGRPVELDGRRRRPHDRAGGRAPIVNGVAEERMRVGCGSATIGMFARQWHGKVDEVVVVDDHITGVLSEHQAGQVPRHARHGHQDARAAARRRGAISRSPSPVPAGAAPTSRTRSRSSAASTRRCAWPGLRLLMVSTTGEQYAYYELDETLRPIEREMPERLRESVERIEENCEPALATVLFMGGAGGSLRAGVTENPVRLTRSVKEALTTVTCGGAPVYVWPGGGITFMVDVTRVPENAFGSVPTPALVAPIEFTMRLADYAALGGHMDEVRPLSSLRGSEARRETPHRDNPWPLGVRRGRSDERTRRRSPSCPTVAACICGTGRSTSSSRPSARATP